MKKIIALFTAAAITTSIFAYDFGGSFYNDSSLKNVNSDSELKFDQLNEISAWLSVPFNNEGNSSFNLAGKLQYENDFGAEETTVFADINNASVTYLKDNFTLTAGRFGVTDLTSVILSQSLDGVSITNTAPEYDINLTAGYTGLLNSHFNSMLDESLSAYSTDTDKVYDAAEKFGLISASITLPYIYNNQTISAENITAIHMQDESYFRNYTTVSITGALSGNLYYTASGTIEFSKFDEDDSEIANLSKIDVTYFGNSHGLALSLNGVYASGTQATLKPFKGFTSQTAVDSNGSDTEYSSKFITGVNASIKPADDILAAANLKTVFDTEGNINYEGFEFGASAYWQVKSDVLLSASLGQYLDGDDSNNNKTKISLKALITF